MKPSSKSPAPATFHPLRQLPSIDRWLRSPWAAKLCSEFGHDEVVTVMRAHLEGIREQVSNGIAPAIEFEHATYSDVLRMALITRRCDGFVPVINATGIVIHTNMGRAPLADKAIEAMVRIAGGYSNLELNLESGKRSSRYQHIETLLVRISGAQAAVVVNNCAAAVLLALNTCCRDDEVLISRGELIEIGGSFRMPDAIANSGAHMVEVGTTNKTHLGDYSNAVSAQTKVVLASHPSNYTISGFTSKPSLRELSEFAHKQGLILIQDLGSGSFVNLDATHLPDEPTVQQCVSAGADLVMFSGDKILGGPQCGIILGKSELIDRIKRNPMLRAMRIDKLSLAALNATLQLYLPPHNPLECIPVLRMICQDKNTLERRSVHLMEKLQAYTELETKLVEDEAFAGGGCMPLSAIPGVAIQLRHTTFSAGEFARRLREGSPAVMGRIVKDRVLLSLRTVLDRETDELHQAVGRALK